jgi:hypothetical protein
MTGHGGQSGEMLRLRTTLEGGTEETAVIKTTKDGGSGSSKMMGLAREAFFYNHFAERLRPELQCAEVFYSYGDMQTGNKTLIMEDLSECVQSGYFFGPTSPLNYGKDLAKITEGLDFSAEQVAAASFEQAAILHAKFFGDESLLQSTYLKGADWRRGEGKKGWDGWQGMAGANWAKTRAKIESGECDWKADPLLVSCIDASIAKTSWEGYQGELKTMPLMLVHGDFHPGNFMLRQDDTSKPHMVLIDFEAAGCGWSGPSECAQLLISHMDPETRRGCEDRLLRGYYEKLVSLVDSDTSGFTFERCKADYVRFGTARWIWLTAVMSGMGMPGGMMQVFNNQLAAFMKDHGVTPENVSMPGS